MHGRVASTAYLTPALVRVVLEGGDLGALQMPDATDAYVNVALPPAGATYDEVFDPQAVRDSHPVAEQPARRRYTVRAWEPATARLTIDFVVHGESGGDSGVAGPWAASAAPGDVLVFTGPSGGYRPSPEADWHLLVGDESALPAIAASLEVLAPGDRAVVRLVCDGPDHEIALDSPADVDVAWLHRYGDERDVSLLVSAVEALDFAGGTPFGFVHGEADEIRGVRRHLLAERGLTRQHLSCSPYWRRTMTDESWRQIKREYVAAMEADSVPS
ncbi:MAG TPA: siderophore-interacting protein [Nocardioides sp.]|jgi:NADPH-dependent ferric siderophore reductase|nr:siderophore-interacting protein [Nocardioides sp.]